MSNIVKISYHNRVARVQMNRPEKRNALNDEMVLALKNVFAKILQNKETKAVILEGAGEAFCAGADLGYLQKLQTNTFEENHADSSSLMELFKTLYSFPKPIIAKVVGPAIAGGCGLATVCDFCFASPESSFGYTEVKIGFVPAIVMVFLSKKIGEGKARELLLTGKIISSQEAKEFGLINSVVEAENLDSHTLNFAEKLATNCSGDSIRMIKEMFFTMPSSYQESLEYAAKMNATARASEDCKKGISAFLNKEILKW